MNSRKYNGANFLGANLSNASFNAKFAVKNFSGANFSNIFNAVIYPFSLFFRNFFLINLYSYKTTMRLRSLTKNQPNELFHVYDGGPKRCPSGTRRNKITGKCDKYTHSLEPTHNTTRSSMSPLSSISSSTDSHSIRSSISPLSTASSTTSSSVPSATHSLVSSFTDSSSSLSSISPLSTRTYSVPSSTKYYPLQLSIPAKLPSSKHSSIRSISTHSSMPSLVSIPPSTKSSPSSSISTNSSMPSLISIPSSTKSSPSSSISTNSSLPSSESIPSSTKSTPSMHYSSIYPSIPSKISYEMPRPKPSPNVKTPLIIDTNIQSIYSNPTVSTISFNSAHSPSIHFPSIYPSPSSKFSFSMQRPKLPLKTMETENLSRQQKKTQPQIRTPHKIKRRLNRTPPKLRTPPNLRPRLNIIQRSPDTTSAKKKRGPNGSRRNKITSNCDKNTKSNTEKNIRCPNGSRRNKITGNCDKNVKSNSQTVTVRRKKCPNGTRKNKITGICEQK